MKTKTGKLIVMLSMTGLINLSMGTAIADDKGIKHNVADLNYDGMVTSEELVTYVQMGTASDHPLHQFLLPNHFLASSASG